jgi:hypothetical protein
MNGELGKFDRVVMNPPFDHGADIKHVEHARKFLKPGGRLVAVVANGPRQRERLLPSRPRGSTCRPGRSGSRARASTRPSWSWTCSRPGGMSTLP